MYTNFILSSIYYIRNFFFNPLSHFSGTTVLEQHQEYKARALYWQANQNERTMPAMQLEELYKQSIICNPFIAEPRIILSQLLYNRGKYKEACVQASKSIDLLYQWGTHWDKRVSFEQWIGFARMMHMRARRKISGMHSLPSKNLSEEYYSTAGNDGNTVTFLQDVMNEFERITEVGRVMSSSVVNRNRVKVKEIVVRQRTRGSGGGGGKCRM